MNNQNGSVSAIKSRKNHFKRVANISNAYNCSAPSGNGVVKREQSNSNSRSGSVPAYHKRPIDKKVSNF